MKRKYTIPLQILTITLCVLLSPILVSAQFWMQKAGGLTVDEAVDVGTDNSGNTYTTGYFTGSATFGSTTLSSSGSSDIFITKTDNNGNFVWAIKAGGTGSDRPSSISVDPLGNTYITGFFYNTATFGSTSITSSGLQDIFVAKYNSSGTLLWVKKAGGPQADIGFGVRYNTWGEVFITGSFKGTATFGGSTVTAANTTSDIFVSKLNSNGVFQWTKKGSGNYPNTGVDLGCDNSGNVYVTGQFSDTVAFDNTHPNTMQNVIFFIKFNSSGAEQWFRIIGAATANVVYGMNSSLTGDSYLTGNFTGTLTFFNAPTNSTLTNTYTNKVFIAKYNASGNLSWSSSIGSDNDLTVRDITIDGNGNSYIGGDFECKLNEFADSYGQGTFNSVGGQDMFVSKFNSAGVWQFARQIGGRNNDLCYGISVSNSSEIAVAGSFSSRINVPTSSGFSSTNLSLWTDASCAANSGFCSDPDYDSYHYMLSSGNKDAFFGICFDEGREPYDFYERSGSGCSRPQGTICIEPNCPDTITACGIATINTQTKICDGIGPGFNYSWSGGSPDPGNPLGNNVNTSGTYTVTMTSSDGCLTFTDDIYADIHPLPNKPAISDDKGVNNDALIVTSLELCDPDTVTLTGSQYGNNTYWWSSSGGTGAVFDTTITRSTTGIDTFFVEDANGCQNFNLISTLVYPAIPPIGVKMLLQDSVTLCEGEYVTAQLYDSIANPTGQQICLIVPPFGTVVSWQLSPFTVPNTSCNTFAYIEPDTSGWHTVTARWVVGTALCGYDTQFVTDSVYVNLLPSPVIPPFTITITGGPDICPGGTVDLTASGAPNYTWTGPGIIATQDSTVTVNAPGFYLVGSIVFDTNQFGCTAQYAQTAGVSITVKPQPTISTTTDVICPGDSVLISSSVTGYHEWMGPNGPLADTTNAVYVTDPGQYFVVVNDADSCGLVSNTITLSQYTTPMIATTGDTFICDGDSTTISLVVNDNSLIEWQAPLSGSDPVQVIYQAGTYTCKITSCGIVTYASVTISSSSVLANITPSGVLCADSSITLSAIPGLTSYLWSHNSLTTPTIPITQGGYYYLTVTDSNGCSGEDSIFVEEILPNASISANGSTFCQGDTFTLSGTPGFVSYLWAPTNETTEQIITTESGIFTLSVVDTNGCSATSSPLNITRTDSSDQLSSSGDTYFCEGDSIVLSASQTHLAQFSWTPGNQNSSSITVYQSGLYSVTGTDSAGCPVVSDSILVTVAPNTLQVPFVSDDTLICEGSTISMYATTDSGTVYWYNPLNDPSIYNGDTLTMAINKSTTFYVQTISEPCSTDFAEINIETINCDSIFVPNVFTPNGDGVNDYWRVAVFQATCFETIIYNRWGNVVFTLTSDKQAWDGTIDPTGEQAPDGVYYYIVNYCKFDGEKAESHGHVTLLRGE